MSTQKALTHQNGATILSAEAPLHRLDDAGNGLR